MSNFVEYKKKKFEEAIDIVKFLPDIITSIAGTTFKNEDGTSRQDILKNIAAILTKFGTIDVKLEKDVNNPYDKDAVSVFVRSLNGSWDQIGFIPIRYCPNCSYTWGGKIKLRNNCPQCKYIPHTNQYEAYLSKYIGKVMDALNISEMISTDNNKHYDVKLLWVSAASGVTTLGAKFAMRFKNVTIIPDAPESQTE